MHGTHVPEPLHTPPGQGVPISTLPDVVQKGPGHASLPIVHGLPVEQVAPDVHTLQLPAPSHVPVPPSPLPHIVPDDAFAPIVQTGVPEEHEITPKMHGLPVLHEAPGVHDTQCPEPSQTPPVHVVPAVLNDACAHTGLPVPH
jgi:hypothetical protein